MKLVCFPNFAAGGLVCELLSPKRADAPSPVFGITYGGSLPHHLLKIGDNGKVFRSFDEERWLYKLDMARQLPNIDDMWVGTHCHPSAIPEKYFNQFEKVLAITTVSEMSKYYRYLRWCWDPSLSRTITPMKIASHILETFEPDDRCINVEFEDIVNGSWVADMNLDIEDYYGWREINSFLYTDQSRLRRIFNKVYASGDQNS